MSAAPLKNRPSSGAKAGTSSAKAIPVVDRGDGVPRTKQIGFNTGTGGRDRLQFISQVLVGYKVEVQVWTRICPCIIVPGSHVSLCRKEWGSGE